MSRENLELVVGGPARQRGRPWRPWVRGAAMPETRQARARRVGAALASVQWASSEAWAGGRDSSASEVISSVPRAAASSTSVASWDERA
jgi:hypothetical protein